LSISDGEGHPGRFEDWLRREYAEGGAFTALIVLLRIAGARVDPLCSTYLNVIGDEVEWSDLVVLFAGAGQTWDGAAFFPVRAREGGPLDNPAARVRLREIETKIDADRLALNAGHFFDAHGRRLRIDETSA
jgi:hypothetical protein